MQTSHSSAELFKAVGAIVGALAFFIVVIHQLTVSAVSVPLPLEWKNSLQFVATRHCTPLAQSFASD